MYQEREKGYATLRSSGSISMYVFQQKMRFEILSFEFPPPEFPQTTASHHREFIEDDEAQDSHDKTPLE